MYLIFVGCGNKQLGKYSSVLWFAVILIVFLLNGSRSVVYGQIMAIDPSLEPRLEVDTSTYGPADQRIWVSEQLILPVGESRQFQRDFLSVLHSKLVASNHFELADPRDVLHWRRAFIRLQHYLTQRDLMVSWKLEARWLIQAEMVPQARGYRVQLIFKDALTGEVKMDSLRVGLKREEMEPWLDQLILQWKAMIQKAVQGELIALERRKVDLQYEVDDRVQPDSGPLLRRMLSQADVIVLDDELSWLVGLEQRMLLEKGKWHDPYWNPPKRKVTVIRHGVELYRHDGKRKGPWRPEIRFQLGQGKQAKHFKFRGEWAYLCEQEIKLINDLGQSISESLKWKSFKPIGVMKRDRQRWDAWERLAKTDVYGHQGLGGLNLLRPNQSVLEKIRLLKGIAKDYPWFQPLYLELRLHPDQDDYGIEKHTHGRLDELLESRHEAFDLQDRLKVDQAMGKAYHTHDDDGEKSDADYWMKLYKLYEDEPELAMKYFSESLPILLYKRGENEVAYNLVMRHMNRHRHSVHHGLPVLFILTMIREDDLPMAQVFIELGLKLYGLNIARVNRYRGVVWALERNGYKDIAEDLKLRLKLYGNPEDLADQAEERLGADIYEAEMASLLDITSLELGKLSHYKGWGLKAIDQKAKWMLFKGKEGYAFREASGDTLVSFELPDEGRRASTISSQLMKTRMIEHDREMWFLFPAMGLYRWPLEQGMPARVEDPPFKNRQLMDLFLIKDEIHVLLWDSKKTSSVLLKLVKDAWQEIEIKPEFGQVSRFLSVADDQVLLLSVKKSLILVYDVKKREVAEKLFYGRNPHYFPDDVVSLGNIYVSRSLGSDDEVDVINAQAGTHMVFAMVPAYIKKHGWNDRQHDHYIGPDQVEVDQRSMPIMKGIHKMVQGEKAIWFLDDLGNLSMSMEGEVFYGPVMLGSSAHDIYAVNGTLWLAHKGTVRKVSEQKLIELMIKKAAKHDPQVLYQEIQKKVLNWVSSLDPRLQYSYYAMLRMYSEQMEVVKKIEPKPKRDTVLWMAKRLEHMDRYAEASELLLKYDFPVDSYPLMEQAHFESMRQRKQWKDLIQFSDHRWKFSQIHPDDVPSWYREKLRYKALKALKGDQAHDQAVWRRLHGDLPEASFQWTEGFFTKQLQKRVQGHASSVMYSRLNRNRQLDLMLDHPLIGPMSKTYTFDYISQKFQTAGRTQEALDWSGSFYERQPVLLQSGQYDEMLNHPLWAASQYGQLYLSSFHAQAYLYKGEINRYLKIYAKNMVYDSRGEDYQHSVYQHVRMLNQDHNQACTLFYQAMGLLNQRKVKQGHRFLGQLIKDYPQSLAAAESWVILGEYQWLEQGNWKEAQESFKQASQIYQFYLKPELKTKGNQDSAAWAGLRQLMLLQLVEENPEQSEILVQQMPQAKGAYRELLKDMTEGSRLQLPKIKVGNLDKEQRTRIVLVHLDEPIMRILPTHAVGNQNRSHYWGPKDFQASLFTPGRDETWQLCNVYLYSRPKNKYGRLGWVYLKDQHHNDWVWVIYHRLYGEDKARLEMHVKQLNHRLQQKKTSD